MDFRVNWTAISEALEAGGAAGEMTDCWAGLSPVRRTEAKIGRCGPIIGQPFHHVGTVDRRRTHSGCRGLPAAAWMIRNGTLGRSMDDQALNVPLASPALPAPQCPHINLSTRGKSADQHRLHWGLKIQVPQPTHP